MTQPIPAKTAQPVQKVYEIEGIKVKASHQGALHKLFSDVEGAGRKLKAVAKKIKDAKAGDATAVGQDATGALATEIVENLIPALGSMLEGMVAKIGGLENWSGVLDDRLTDVEDDALAMDEEDGNVVLDAILSLRAIVQTIDTSAMSDAERAVIESALAKSVKGEEMVRDYMSDGEDEDGEGGDEDEDDEG